MAETTSISWCDHTWSPWYGCTQVSMGAQGACEGCYARFLSETRHKRVIFGGPGRGEGTRDVRADSAWRDPVRWNRKTPGAFVFPSMCDPFDNHPALVEPRRRFFDLIRATPNLTWLLLTKRPGNIVKLFTEALSEADKFMLVDPPLTSLADCWPRNAAIGCTVVSQDEGDRDIPKLLRAKATLNPAFAFLSMEPLLGPVELRPYFTPRLKGPTWAMTGVDWVIAGGETDQGAHKARPSDPNWFRSLRDQCAAAQVPFHFKQWGEWRPMADAGIVEDGPVARRNGDVPDWMDRSVRLADGSARRVRGHSFTPHATNLVYRMGKAGDPCTLDGVTHDARPEVRR